MTHPVLCPESLSTPLHMYMPSVKTKLSFCSINDHFFKTKAFCFINQNPLDGSQYQLAFPKFRVFIHLWATYFRVYTAGRRTLFQHFYDLFTPVIMSSRECRVFYPGGGGGGGGGGDLPQLAMPNTYIFHFF